MSIGGPGPLWRRICHKVISRIALQSHKDISRKCLGVRRGLLLCLTKPVLFVDTCYLFRFIMFEPRGHSGMFGAMQVDADLPDADAAFLFMHQESYPTMCGHAVICLGR